jgi:hypothetical protein
MQNKSRFNIFMLKGKLGEIRDWMNAHHFPPKLLFYLMGVISTIWFIVRVIPKPSRATYPCMQVAAPFMSGFVVYLLSLGGITLALKKAKKNLFQARYIAAAAFFAVALSGMVFTVIHDVQFSFADTQTQGHIPRACCMGVEPKSYK